MKKIYKYAIFTIILYLIQIDIANAACFDANIALWNQRKTFLYIILTTIISIMSGAIGYNIKNFVDIKYSTPSPSNNEVALGSTVTAQDCISRTERYAIRYCNARNGQINETNIEIDYDKIKYGMKYCCEKYLFYVNSLNVLKVHDIAFYENGTCCMSNCTSVRNNAIQEEYNK